MCGSSIQLDGRPWLHLQFSLCSMYHSISRSRTPLLPVKRPCRVCWSPNPPILPSSIPLSLSDTHSHRVEMIAHCFTFPLCPCLCFVRHLIYDCRTKENMCVCVMKKQMSEYTFFVHSFFFAC